MKFCYNIGNVNLNVSRGTAHNQTGCSLADLLRLKRHPPRSCSCLFNHELLADAQNKTGNREIGVKTK